MHKVFSYGTLKRNEPNHEELTDRNALFISEVTTVEKWPLIITSNLNMPFLLNKPGHGKVNPLTLTDHFMILINKMDLC